jgi:hypothetical protein
MSAVGIVGFLALLVAFGGVFIALYLVDIRRTEEREASERAIQQVARQVRQGTTNRGGETMDTYDPTRRAWGIVSIVIGLLSFCASAGLHGGGTPEGSLVAGLLNPLFFVGVPLGWWLVKSAYAHPNLSPCPSCGHRVAPSAQSCPRCGRPFGRRDAPPGLLVAPPPAELMSPPPARPKAATPVDPSATPKLIPCPDCGRYVSRFAPSCPQCGRPLTPEKTPEA